MRSRWKARDTRGRFIILAQRIYFIFKSVSHGVASNINSKSKAHSITSESLGQRERVHGGPVVGRVLRLLRGLLVQVVHGAEGVHGVQRVAVDPVVLHAGSGSRPAREGGEGEA